MGPVDGVHVAAVLVAAGRHERRLRDDDEASLAQVGEQLGRDHCAVLDPIAGPRADDVPRGEGEHELGARHAVHGDAPAGASRPPEVGDEVVERGEAGVVEDDLHRAARQPDVELGERRRAGDGDGEREAVGLRRVGERLECGGIGRRREVGHCGDAVGRQLRRRGADVGDRAADAPAQLVVHPVQAPGRPARRVALDAVARQRLDVRPGAAPRC